MDKNREQTIVIIAGAMIIVMLLGCLAALFFIFFGMPMFISAPAPTLPTQTPANTIEAAMVTVETVTPTFESMPPSVTPNSITPEPSLTPIVPIPSPAATNMPTPQITDPDQSNGRSYSPIISSDGQIIAFTSTGNLTGNAPHQNEAVFVRDRLAQTTELINVTLAGQAGERRVYGLALSGNGRVVAYYSHDGDLVSDDEMDCGAETRPVSCEDLFIYDRETGTTERLPLGRVQGLGKDYTLALSEDGRFVAYSFHIYDRMTGQTTDIPTIDGEHPAGSVFAPRFADDDNILAFVSSAANLVPGDTNETHDVFVWNRTTNVVERVSAASDGSEGNDSSGAFLFHEGIGSDMAISGDGRFVAFASLATNLTPDPINECDDYRGFTRACYNLFLHDRETSSTQLITQSADQDSNNPALSGDGRFLTFASLATTLTNDTLPDCQYPAMIDCGQIYLYDQQTGQISLISQNIDGQAATQGSWQPDISANGRTITFVSRADNLVPGDTNNASDIFTFDLETNLIERVNLNNTAVSPTPLPTAVPPTALTLDDTLVLYTVIQNDDWALQAYPDNPAFQTEVFDQFYGPVARMEEVGRYTQFNFGPQLSPNGRYLLLPGVGGYSDPGSGAPADAENVGLWFVNLQTDEVRQLLPRPKPFTWSPYGDQITYIDGDTLYTLSVAEGAEPQPLFSHPDLWSLYARWSPDGSTIATMSTAQGELDENGNPKLIDTYWLVDANSGEATELAVRPGAAIERVAAEVTWSPTGRYLLIRGEVFDLNGQLLSPDFPGGAYWLPVSESLAHGERENLLVKNLDGMRIMTIEGQEVTRITDEDVNTWAFSHNGRYLAYLEPESKSNLNVFDLETHTTQLFDPTPIDVQSLHWSGEDDYLLLDDYHSDSPIWGLALRPESEVQVLIENGVLIKTLPAPAKHVPQATAALSVAIPTISPTDAAPKETAIAQRPVVFFARDDDLWRADINGEQTEQLTNDGALAWGMTEAADDWRIVALSVPPRVSPDGRWIAFSPDGNTFSLVDVTAPGQPRRIAPGTLIPAWSPDSRYLAYGVDDKLLIYDLENDLLHTVVEDTSQIGNVVWSPDMQQLAFACCFERLQPYSPADFGEIRRVELATGQVKIVDVMVSTIGGGTSPLCWTAAGQVVKWRDITPDEVSLCSYDRAASAGLSPDGSQIASFAPAVPTDDFWEGDSLLTIRQADTDEVVWQHVVNGRATSPRWSSDGSTIIFQRGDAQEGNLSIWRIAVGGTGEPQLIIDNGFLLDMIPQW